MNRAFLPHNGLGEGKKRKRKRNKHRTSAWRWKSDRGNGRKEREKYFLRGRLKRSRLSELDKCTAPRARWDRRRCLLFGNSRQVADTIVRYIYYILMNATSKWLWRPIFWHSAPKTLIIVARRICASRLKFYTHFFSSYIRNILFPSVRSCQ